ncbi:MAG: peptide chain release factor N(5)-glutamine methyltransferase [Chloroflexota bacterium]|nr:peptide chain release factor N(5)-glutamine methyltransferase [Chloroflexota bacterium]
MKEALRQARDALVSQGIEEAPLEAEVLLRHCLGLDRAGLFVRLEERLSREQTHDLSRLLERRGQGEPTAYITGHREFFGLDFLVDRRVLIPRPETELLVEKALEFLARRPTAMVADVGTGSGAVAVSLAVHCPGARLYASDLSPQALEVASLNCQRHGVASRVVLLPGDLLAPLPDKVDLIVANLPYVKAEDWPRLGPEIRDFEPGLALRGGGDGLELISRLLVEAPAHLKPGGALLLEVGADEGQEALARASSAAKGAITRLWPDLAGRDRVLSVELP